MSKEVLVKTLVQTMKKQYLWVESIEVNLESFVTTECLDWISLKEITIVKRAATLESCVLEK